MDDILSLPSDISISNKYSSLELASINNNIDKIKEELEKGNTIYVNKDSICIKLCNGYCNKELCQRNCLKTALFYSLINNCRAYKTLYIILQEINNKLNIDIVNKSNRLISKMRNTECLCSKGEYCKAYNIDYLYYDYYKNLLEDYKPIIIDKIGSIPKTFDNIKLVKLTKCIHKEYIYSDFNNLKNVFLNTFKYYLETVKICDILYNQQAFELSQYIISNNENISKLNNVYYNELININYISSKINILLYVILNYNNVELVENLLNNGSDVFLDYKGKNIIFTIIKNENIAYLELLYKYGKNNRYIINERDDEGRTPLMLILENPNLHMFIEKIINLPYLNCGIIDNKGNHILSYLNKHNFINYYKLSDNSENNDTDDIVNSYEDLSDSYIVEDSNITDIYDNMRLIFIIMKVIIDILKEDDNKKKNTKSYKIHNNLMKFL